MAYVGLGDTTSPQVIDWPTAQHLLYSAPGVVFKTITNPATGQPITMTDSSKSPSWVKVAVDTLAKALHGGRYPVTIAGISYIVDNSKPTTPPDQGYEWVYSANTGWIQKKSGGGILGAIGSVVKGVANVALPIASVALPGVGIGGSVVRAITTANSVVQGTKSGVNAVKSVVSPKPIVGTLPLKPPSFAPSGDSTVDQFNQGGNAILPGMPSWVLPVALVAGALLLAERR